MAESYMFFDSSHDDIREYTASEFAEYFSDFLTDGVYANPRTQAMGLKVSINNFNLSISEGKGMIRGYRYENDSNLNMAIDKADNVLDRIDRVVLKLDIVNKKINLQVKKGTMGSQPIPPTLIDNASIKELPIAQIRVNKGSTTGIIKDERIPVSSLIEIPLQELEDEFNNWFNSVKGTLNASEVYLSSSNFTSNNVQGGMNELFQNVSNGKGLIASAITDMEVPTSSEDTFQTMANNILSIETGEDLGAVNATLTNQGQSFTIPEGLHNGAGKVNANITNLSAGNIRSGVNVGGVVGNFKASSTGAMVSTRLSSQGYGSGIGSKSETLVLPRTCLGVAGYLLTEDDRSGPTEILFARTTTSVEGSYGMARITINDNRVSLFVNANPGIYFARAQVVAFY